MSNLIPPSIRWFNSPRFTLQGYLLSLWPTTERLRTADLSALLGALREPSHALGRLHWIADCYDSLSDQQVILHELVHQLAQAARFDTAALRQQLERHAQSMQTLWAPQLAGDLPEEDSTTYAQLRYMRAVQSWSHTLYLKMQQLYQADRYPALNAHPEARALLAQFTRLLNIHYQAHRSTFKANLATLEACYTVALHTAPTEENASEQSRHQRLMAQSVIDTDYARLEAQLQNWCFSRDLITNYQCAQHTMRVLSDIKTSIRQWRLDHAAALRAFRLQWEAQCLQVMQQLAQQDTQSKQLEAKLAQQEDRFQGELAKQAAQAEQSQQEVANLKCMMQELLARTQFVTPTLPLAQSSSPASALEHSSSSTISEGAPSEMGPHSFFMSTASERSPVGSDAAAPSPTASEIGSLPLSSPEERGYVCVSSGPLGEAVKCSLLGN